MFDKLLRNGWFFDADGGSGAGTGDGSGAGAGGGGQGGGNAGGAGQGKTFSEEQVNEIVKERLKRADSSAVQKLLDELGVKTPDDAKALLAKAKDAEAAQLTELQKAQREAQDAKAAADKAKDEKTAALKVAQDKLLRSLVIAEAVKQGFDDGEVNSVWLALRGDAALVEKIKPKGEDDFEGVDEAVKEIAKAHPRWLKGDAKPPDLNATQRGGGPASDELVQRKRQDSSYAPL